MPCDERNPGHKGHKTKRGLSQDQKRKSIEPWEKAYRKGKKKLKVGINLKIKKFKIPKEIAKMPVKSLNQSGEMPTVAILIIIIFIILVLFGIKAYGD